MVGIAEIVVVVSEKDCTVGTGVLSLHLLLPGILGR